MGDGGDLLGFGILTGCPPSGVSQTPRGPGGRRDAVTNWGSHSQSLMLSELSGVLVMGMPVSGTVPT